MIGRREEAMADSKPFQLDNYRLLGASGLKVSRCAWVR